MSQNSPTIACPNCGCEFELDEAFAEHFEAEKQIAVQTALANERKIAEEKRKEIQQEAEEAAEKKYKLTLIAKEEEMKRIQKQLDELQKRTRQGSMELQGEALEVHLKAALEELFPLDNIADVKKGQSGADLLHTVINPRGQRCGVIVWEAKNTKNWSDGWIPKIKEDASRSNAQISVIVSVALPENITTFDLVDGVWVCCVDSTMALAQVLRMHLLHMNDLQRALTGQGSKMEAVYAYLTSTTFRDRVQSIVETWESLKNQIDAEERAMQKQWNERRKRLNTMIRVTTDMYTDISSIIGGDMLEVPGLTLPVLPTG